MALTQPIKVVQIDATVTLNPTPPALIQHSFTLGVVLGARSKRVRLKLDLLEVHDVWGDVMMKSFGRLTNQHDVSELHKPDADLPGKYIC